MGFATAWMLAAAILDTPSLAVDSNQGPKHRIAFTTPVPSEAACASCALEAAAYAAAIAQLEAAQQVADEAYIAWRDCVDPEPEPEPEPGPGVSQDARGGYAALKSILED